MRRCRGMGVLPAPRSPGARLAPWAPQPLSLASCTPGRGGEAEGGRLGLGQFGAGPRPVGAASVPPSGRQDPTPGEAPGAQAGRGGRPERVGSPSPRLS